MRALLLALAAAPAAVPALGQDIPRLSTFPVITEGLINTAIAYEVDRVCDELGGRFIIGLAFLNSLRAYARDQGASEEEIEAYIDNRPERDRLEAIARGRLRDMGAVEGQPATYCAVGRAQIAADSPIGRLLYD